MELLAVGLIEEEVQESKQNPQYGLKAVFGFVAVVFRYIIMRIVRKCGKK